MISSTRAMELMEQVTYKPGWEFEPELWTGDTILWVTVLVIAPDTSVENARRGYPDELRFTSGFMVNLAECPDEETFLRKAFNALFQQIECHESREFFRIRSQDWRAPFHPHQECGTAAWDRTDHVSGYATT